jgi:hypothetical protein
LSFDAGYAKLTGLEGKYTVRNLTLYSQGRASMLHRSYDGLGAAFKPVRLSQLADLVVVPPAVEEMQEEGLFKLQ